MRRSDHDVTNRIKTTDSAIVGAEVVRVDPATSEVR